MTHKYIFHARYRDQLGNKRRTEITAKAPNEHFARRAVMEEFLAKSFSVISLELFQENEPVETAD
jgi:hypothetical protein